MWYITFGSPAVCKNGAFWLGFCTLQAIKNWSHLCVVKKILNLSDVSVKSGTVWNMTYTALLQERWEAYIDSRTTMLESRFCVLDFASYFSLKYSIGVVLASYPGSRWAEPTESLGTRLELYVRQNLVKGLGLRLQWYHLPLAEIWYSWNLVFLDEINLVNETHFLFTQGNEIWEKMPLEGSIVLCSYIHICITVDFSFLWTQKWSTVSIPFTSISGHGTSLWLVSLVVESTIPTCRIVTFHTSIR